ncbi:MAG: HAD-IA family hydrolase, partial [bacterium]|nr:HAD-IA family hydrolase [bacterium]MDD6515878.1 HAD-IA family hydrolase [bacterium]
IVQEFDGIVFSAPLVMAKPKPEIYQYLFDTYHLKPEESFFIDDKPENIASGQALGMDGYIFKGDIAEVCRKLGLD